MKPKSKIDIVRSIIKNRQHKRVHWEVDGEKCSDILDFFTASAINLVYEALSDANKEKLMAGTWHQIVRFCLKHTKTKVT